VITRDWSARVAWPPAAWCCRACNLFRMDAAGLSFKTACRTNTARPSCLPGIRRCTDRLGHSDLFNLRIRLDFRRFVNGLGELGGRRVSHR